MRILFPTIFSGSGYFSGSFDGDGSRLYNIVSSSYALTASYALNNNGVGFPFTGNAKITGSLSITGSKVDFTDVRAISGSIFSGSFVGDGSGLTGITVSQVATAKSNFHAVYSASVYHNFNSRNVNVSVYDNNNRLFFPDSIVLSTPNRADITFSGPSTGYVVVSKGGHIIEPASGSGIGFPFSGSAVITGSFLVSGSKVDFTKVQAISGSIFSGSFVGDGSGLTGLTVSQVATVQHSFVSTYSASINHNFNSRNVNVAVYDNNNKLFFPDSITLATPDRVDLRFSGISSGYAVVSKGGHLVTGVFPISGSGIGFPFSGSAVITGSLFVSGSYVDFTNVKAISGSIFSGSFVGDGSNLTGLNISQIATVQHTFTSVLSASINHNFNSRNVNVAVYDTNNKLFFPDSIRLTTPNIVDVTFSGLSSGYVVISKGGHLVTGVAIPSGSGVGFPFSGSAVITGSLLVSGSHVDFTSVKAISGSIFSGSFVGDGSGLTGLTISQVATVQSNFTSVLSASINHNFNSRNVNVSVYDTNNKLFFPDSITLTTPNTVDVIFSGISSGYVVISKGGHIIAPSSGSGIGFPFSGSAVITGSLLVSGSHVDFTNVKAISGSIFSGSFRGDGRGLTGLTISQVATVQSNFTSVLSASVNHNFNSRNVNVSVYDTNNKLFFPDSITLTTPNTVDVIFSGVSSGYVVVSKGGHILSGSLQNAVTLDNQLPSYYLDYNNLTNVPPTSSGDGFPFVGDAVITGSFLVSGSKVDFSKAKVISGSLFSGSFVGDGSGLTGITVSEIATIQSTFTSVYSASVNHNFNSKNINVAVYDNNDKLFFPDSITLTTPNRVDLIFSGLSSGYVVVSKGGHIVTGTYPISGSGIGFPFSGKAVITGSLFVSGSKVDFTKVKAISGSIFSGSFRGDGSNLTGLTISQATTVQSNFTSVLSASVNHNFNSRNVNVSVYDSNNRLFFPDSITLTTLNRADIVFSGLSSGYVVISKGGHILSGSLQNAVTLDNRLPSYYLDYNNLTNVPPTSSGDGFPFAGDAVITGSLLVSGSKIDFSKAKVISGSIFSGSFVGDGSGLTGITVSEVATIQATFVSIYSASINHNFNSRNVNVAVYDSSNRLFFPDSITLPTLNRVDITFSGPTSGYAVISKGGHIVSAISSISGSGTDGRLAKFKGSNYVTGSLLQESTAGIKLVGNMQLTGSFAVSGSRTSGGARFLASMTIPVGTTAQRPISPLAGSIRFNTSTNLLEIYTGTTWRTI
jgi:hypothetical protein